MEVVKAKEQEILACIHCLQPTRSGEKFCCSGCEAAYSFINRLGLEEFYSRRASRKLMSVEAQLPEEFDNLEYQKSFVRPVTGNYLAVDFILEGITCSACVWLLERLPLVEPKIKSVRLNLGAARAEIIFSEELSLLELALIFFKLGYRPHLVARKSNEERIWLLRAGVAFASMIASMHVSLFLYSGMLHGMSLGNFKVTAIVAALVALPALIFSAKPFYQGAWAALKVRALSIDSLVTLTVLIGASVSLNNIFLGKNETYFEALSMLIALLLIGRLVVHWAQKKLYSDSQLFNFKIFSAEGKLKIGETVNIKSGETFPCDGVVTQGKSFMNSAWLTGEEREQELRPGVSVWAGSLNCGDMIEVKVTAVGRQTQAGQILEKLNSTEKSRISSFTQKLETYFVWFTGLSVAAMVILNWRDPHVWNQAVSLLLVLCPCALGLAIPTVMGTALSQGAKSGLLIKGEKVLEKLSQVTAVVFDKTGTLTESTLEIKNARWVSDALGVLNLSQAELENILAQAVRRINHPTLRPLEKYFKSEGHAEITVEEVLGKGALISTRQFEIKLGSPTFLNILNASFNVGVAVNGRLVAEFFYADNNLKNGAFQIVQFLKNQNKKVFILSGDHSQNVARVGEKLQIPKENVFSHQTPEMKLQFVTKLSEEECVMMVGDGVNDALAFKKSHVGVGMTGGAGVAMETCDVYLLNADLKLLQSALEGAKRVKNTVYMNLLWVFIYNVVGFVFVYEKAIGPILCAILMPLSSATVALIATKRKYFRGK